MDPAGLQQIGWIRTVGHNCCRISGFLMRLDNVFAASPDRFSALPLIGPCTKASFATVHKYTVRSKGSPVVEDCQADGLEAPHSRRQIPASIEATKSVAARRCQVQGRDRGHRNEAAKRRLIKPATTKSVIAPAAIPSALWMLRLVPFGKY